MPEFLRKQPENTHPNMSGYRNEVVDIGPRERARRENKDIQDATQDGKREIDVELARELFEDNLVRARRGILEEKQFVAGLESVSAIARSISVEYANTLIYAGRAVLGWLRDGKYTEDTAIQHEASRMAEHDGIDFVTGMQLLGKMVRQLRDKGHDEIVGELTHDEELQAQRVAARQTRYFLERQNPTGVFATPELKLFLGFTDHEIKLDARIYQAYQQRLRISRQLGLYDAGS